MSVLRGRLVKDRFWWLGSVKLVTKEGSITLRYPSLHAFLIFRRIPNNTEIKVLDASQDGSNYFTQGLIDAQYMNVNKRDWDKQKTIEEAKQWSIDSRNGNNLIIKNGAWDG
jgi:hypothetical protein